MQTKAAVSENELARDQFRVVTGKERDQRRKILGFAAPFDGLVHHCAIEGFIFDVSRGPWSIDQSRRDGIYGDALVPQFPGKNSRHPDNSRLAGNVRHLPRISEEK